MLERKGRPLKVEDRGSLHGYLHIQQLVFESLPCYELLKNDLLPISALHLSISLFENYKDSFGVSYYHYATVQCFNARIDTLERQDKC